MVKVHFNQNIQTVETYDAGDYDRTSVPISELNDEEFNEMECYRLEMKKQTIEEYQKRWRKTRNSNSSSFSETKTSINNNDGDDDNLVSPLKSCLINKNSNASNNLNNKLEATAMNAAMTVAMSSSLEDDTSLFGEGQAQPNIDLNLALHTMDYNSDEGGIPKESVELSSSIESNNDTYPKEHLHIFTEQENEKSDVKGIKIFEDHNHLSVISPLSFESNDVNNDADVEESAEDNSFLKLFEDSFEKSAGEEGDSDYIKDMSLTEGENSITLSHHILSDDIPTTSYHSSQPRLFTDSLFTSSPILSEAVLDDNELRSSQLQEETPEESQEEGENDDGEEKEGKNLQLQDEVLDVLKIEEEKEKLERKLVQEPEEENSNTDSDSDNEIDKHPYSDTSINYGGSQHINIKPRRNNIYNEFTCASSCPFGKPMSFLDDLPEVIQSPLSSSLPASSIKSDLSKPSNFFGSPFSPTSKSPYSSSFSSFSALQSNRARRYCSSSYSSNGSSNSNDGNYLVSKRNYLSISGNRDPKQKSYGSSGRRLSNITTSKWEGIGSRSSTKSNNNKNNSNNNTSTNTKYYPRPATKLVTTSPYSSSSWIYDASF